MYVLKNIIKWLVILLLFIDVLFILVCNFSFFGCVAIRIDENIENTSLKAGDTVIFRPKNEYKEGDIILVSNLDKIYLEKIKKINNNIIETTSVDGKVDYEEKNIEDVVGVYFVKINLTMIITFITTLSLGILFLIFDYYLEDKKSSKNVNP